MTSFTSFPRSSRVCVMLTDSPAEMRRAQGVFLWATATFIVAELMAGALTSEVHGAERPNILFIGVDDLRPELGCYGATHIKSPNIDRLTREGVLFERAYCQWAVCMPSRASLLSGLRPDSFGGKANRFRAIVPDVVTLPQHFKNNSYFAQSLGKIYHGSWETAYVGNSFQDAVSWSVPRFASSPRYYFSEEIETGESILTSEEWRGFEGFRGDSRPSAIVSAGNGIDNSKALAISHTEPFRIDNWGVRRQLRTAVADGVVWVQCRFKAPQTWICKGQSRSPGTVHAVLLPEAALLRKRVAELR